MSRRQLLVSFSAVMLATLLAAQGAIADEVPDPDLSALLPDSPKRAYDVHPLLNGILDEGALLPDSYGGKFHPSAVLELIDSLPSITRAFLRRKVTPKKALIAHKARDYKVIRALFDKVESHPRYELNIYIVGTEDDDAPPPGTPAATGTAADAAPAAPGPGGAAQR